MPGLATIRQKLKRHGKISLLSLQCLDQFYGTAAHQAVVRKKGGHNPAADYFSTARPS